MSSRALPQRYAAKYASAAPTSSSLFLIDPIKTSGLSLSFVMLEAITGCRHACTVCFSSVLQCRVVMFVGADHALRSDRVRVLAWEDDGNCVWVLMLKMPTCLRGPGSDSSTFASEGPPRNTAWPQGSSGNSAGMCSLLHRSCQCCRCSAVPAHRCRVLRGRMVVYLGRMMFSLGRGKEDDVFFGDR